jgi:predicted nucleic acid-binding Zn ribbon protein
MPGIVPHRHCIVCGKAIEPDQTFCSDECKNAWEKDRKRQRNFMLLWFILLFVLLFMMFASAPR